MATAPPTITLKLVNPVQDERLRFAQALEAGELEALVSHYPIRESKLPDALAKALRFRRGDDYEAAARVLLRKDVALRQTLRERYFSELAPAFTKPSS